MTTENDHIRSKSQNPEDRTQHGCMDGWMDPAKGTTTCSFEGPGGPGALGTSLVRTNTVWKRHRSMGVVLS